MAGDMNTWAALAPYQCTRCDVLFAARCNTLPDCWNCGSGDDVELGYYGRGEQFSCTPKPWSVDHTFIAPPGLGDPSRPAVPIDPLTDAA